MPGTVDLWLGTATDRDAFDAYFAESYEDELAPISPFAESQGETFYDHDFLETQFDGACTTIDDALQTISFSGSFADAARERIPDGEFNLIVAFFGDAFTNPRSGRAEDVELTYLGRFPYDPKSGSLAAEDRPARL